MYQTCSQTLKGELLKQKLSPHFERATLLSAFLTWLQFPSVLASLSNQAFANSWEWMKQKTKKTKNLKLNLKLCFSWKPSCAAINQGRHFHAPHFSWFLSEFPPFLFHSTLAPEVPRAALAADHNQLDSEGWPVLPFGV